MKETFTKGGSPPKRPEPEKPGNERGQHVTDHLGETTEDLRDLHQPHPAEHGIRTEDTDAVARRFGNRCFRAGLYIAGGTFTAALVVTAACGDNVLDNYPGARLFCSLAIIAAIATGGALIVIGGVDRLIRPIRAMDRQMILGGIDARKRIGRIEHAMDLVAEGMPANNDLHNWRGYTSAIREGFVQQTGTDGPATPGGSQGRRSYLGLVPRDQPPAS